MLRAVRANSADARHMLAKDEGHGFQKSNRDAQNAAIAAFPKLKLLGQRLEWADALAPSSQRAPTICHCSKRLSDRKFFVLRRWMKRLRAQSFNHVDIRK